jgi:branched-chain amino acid transport system ATP-binding protein
LLDEPLAGLTVKEIEILSAVIKNLHEEGVTLIWVEHIIDAVEKHASRVVVLNEGKKILEGKPKEIINDEQFIAIYLGEEEVA